MPHHREGEIERHIGIVGIVRDGQADRPALMTLETIAPLSDDPIVSVAALPSA